MCRALGNVFARDLVKKLAENKHFEEVFLDIASGLKTNIEVLSLKTWYKFHLNEIKYCIKIQDIQKLKHNAGFLYLKNQKTNLF